MSGFLTIIIILFCESIKKKRTVYLTLAKMAVRLKESSKKGDTFVVEKVNAA